MVFNIFAPKRPMHRPNNQGFIQLTKNLAYHARTKHIDVCYHFIERFWMKVERRFRRFEPLRILQVWWQKLWQRSSSNYIWTWSTLSNFEEWYLEIIHQKFSLEKIGDLKICQGEDLRMTRLQRGERTPCLTLAEKKKWVEPPPHKKRVHLIWNTHLSICQDYLANLWLFSLSLVLFHY